MSDERNGLLGTVFAFLTGAVIGAGLALLYAPQSGEETRKKIKEAGDKVADDIKANYEKISQEAQKAINTVKSASEKAIDQVKTFYEGTKESLKKEVIKEVSEKTKAPAKKKT
jgi:gas vesicle protein